MTQEYQNYALLQSETDRSLTATIKNIREALIQKKRSLTEKEEKPNFKRREA